nr:myosin heavy chain, clone 203-like isoform X1 [Nothobranchius furzeri]
MSTFDNMNGNMNVEALLRVPKPDLIDELLRYMAENKTLQDKLFTMKNKHEDNISAVTSELKQCHHDQLLERDKQINLLKDDVRRKHKKILKLQEEYRMLGINLKDSEKELYEVKQQRDAAGLLEFEIHDLQNKITFLTKENEELLKNKHTLDVRMHHVDQCHTEAQTKILELEEQLQNETTSRIQADTLIEMLKPFEHKASYLEIENELLRDEIHNLTNKSAEHINQINLLTEKTNEQQLKLNFHHEYCGKRLQASQIHQNDQMVELKTELHTSQMNCRIAQNELSEYKHFNNVLSDELSNANQEISKLENDIHKSEHTKWLDSRTQDRKAHRDKCDALEKQLQHAMIELERATEQMKRSANEDRIRTNEMKKLEEDKIELSKQLELRRAQILELNGKLQQSNHKLETNKTFATREKRLLERHWRIKENMLVANPSSAQEGNPDNQPGCSTRFRNRVVLPSKAPKRKGNHLPLINK